MTRVLAYAIGQHLAAHPPEGYRDRFSAEGWMVIADAVLEAREILGRATDDIEGRQVDGGTGKAESAHDA